MMASSAVKASRDPCLTWMQTYVMPESDAARNWRCAAEGKARVFEEAYKSSRSLFVQRARVPSSMHLLKKSHSHQRSNLAIAIMEATTSFASALDMS